MRSQSGWLPTDLWRRSSDLLVLAPGPVAACRAGREAVGMDRATFNSTVLSTVEAKRERRWQEFVRQLNWQLHDRAVPLYTRLAAAHVREKARELST